MSRIRQEAKIVKNYHKEIQWQPLSDDIDNIEVASYKGSMYSLGRINIATERLVRAMKRRYVNQARAEFKKNGDSSLFRLLVHKSCSSYELYYDALEWWNIPNDIL